LAEGEKKKINNLLYKVKGGRKIVSEESKRKGREGKGKRQNPPLPGMHHPAQSPKEASYGRGSVIDL
jgi:hypothetical protein